MVRLGDVCEEKIDSLSSNSECEIIYIDIASVDNLAKKIISSRTINAKNAPSRAKQILEINDIIVSTVRPNLNAVAVVKQESDKLIVGSTGYCVLRCTNKANPKFVFYFCQSKAFVNKLVKVAKGASYPAVSDKDVKGVKIPLPPLEVQKKIAQTLDVASELITLRKRQLAKLDQLIKATFYDMFGDPVTNEKGWEVRKLGDIGELARGISKHRPRNDPKLLGGGYPLIQTGDIANAGLYINKFKQTYSELGLLQSKMWDRGTLCITIAANIAKTAILGLDACFPDSIVGFKPDKFTNIIFIYTWFQFFQKVIEEQAPESAQKNINLKILNDLNVISPPLDLQNKFAAIVTKIEEQKALVQQAIDESQYLFDSLMSEYFD